MQIAMLGVLGAVWVLLESFELRLETQDAPLKINFRGARGGGPSTSSPPSRGTVVVWMYPGRGGGETLSPLRKRFSHGGNMGEEKSL